MRLESDHTDGYAGIYLIDDSGSPRAHFGHGNSNVGVAAVRDKTFFGSLGATDVVITTDNTARMTIDGRR